MVDLAYNKKNHIGTVIFLPLYSYYLSKQIQGMFWIK